jgi:phytanoyl-CoA hydroxylase
MISTKQYEKYQEQGFLVVSGLFSKDEVEFYKQHYMEMRAAGSYPGDSAGVDNASDDPLKKYPRMIQMHHWDETSVQSSA